MVDLIFPQFISEVNSERNI